MNLHVRSSVIFACVAMVAIGVVVFVHQSKAASKGTPKAASKVTSSKNTPNGMPKAAPEAASKKSNI
jgi:hypothetical protein